MDMGGIRENEMLMVSKQELIEKEVCQAELDRFIIQTNNSDEPFNIIDLITDNRIMNGSDFMMIAGKKKINTKKQVQCAINCAKTMVHLANSSIPQLAIDVAQQCLDHPSKENRKKALAAAKAADKYPYMAFAYAAYGAVERVSIGIATVAAAVLAVVVADAYSGDGKIKIKKQINTALKKMFEE